MNPVVDKPQITAINLFAPLNGRTFADFRDLETALAAVFRERVKELPNGYGYRELARLGMRRGWIRKHGDKVIVNLPY